MPTEELGGRMPKVWPVCDVKAQTVSGTDLPRVLKEVARLVRGIERGVDSLVHAYDGEMGVHSVTVVWEERRWRTD